MKALVVYYSKSGTTAKVAREIIKSKGCDFDEIQYDEQAKTIRHSRKPSDYGHIILLAPVWAFSLAEPMKQYIAQNGAGIKRYDLIVTCGGLGLWGCVRNCVAAIGKKPEKARKIRSGQVKEGRYNIADIL